MYRMTAAFLSLLLAPGVAFAQEWRATFVPDEGSRIDYLPKKDGFEKREDKTSYRYEFKVPAEGNTATMRLVPTKKNAVPAEDYPAVVIQRSDDMIVLVLVHTAAIPLDKLFPRAGVGFSSTTSAYMGNPTMKILSPADPDIPVASASIFPLKEAEK